MLTGLLNDLDLHGRTRNLANLATMLCSCNGIHKRNTSCLAILATQQLLESPWNLFHDVNIKVLL